MCLIGVMALGAAYHLRHNVIDAATIASACARALGDWSCTIRDATVAAIAPSAFGFAALLSALLNLWRPSLVLCALSLACAGLGLMLHNVALSAFALAILPLSLARPAAAAR